VRADDVAADRQAKPGAGRSLPLHEALKAQQKLAEAGLGVRVIDCYSVKPIDGVTLKKAAGETGRIIVVEDHYPEGGLGEAVASAMSESSSQKVPLIHLAVRKIPMSGSASELLAYESIGAAAIIEAVHRLLK